MPRLLLVVFGLLFGLAVSELSLRIADYSFPEFYQVDYVRGYSLRPNVAGWYRKEGGAYVRINSEGLRDIEHSKTKPPGTFRIAILGDSYAEALQVPREQAFPALLEQPLSSCSTDGRKVEVINFGVSGYGTAQELLTLREVAWSYSPDLVLLAFTTGNDISDNWRRLKSATDIPYFTQKNGELILDNSFRQTSSYRWKQALLSTAISSVRDHSRVVQVFLAAQRNFRLWIQSRSVTPAGSSHGGSNTSQPIYSAPSNDDWIGAWDITEKLLSEMNREVRSRGVRFVVVTLSNPEQVLPYIRNPADQALFYPDNRIKNLGTREGFEVIVLAPGLQRYAQANNVFLHGFGADLGNGHWNEQGHRIAADYIFDSMCSSGLLK